MPRKNRSSAAAAPRTSPLTVAEVMTRDVATCRPDQTLEAAAQVLWEGDCGSVPVVAGDGRLVGILTDRDICMAAYTRGLPLQRIEVSVPMASEVEACQADEEASMALARMAELQLRRLPVVDEAGRLVGLLSLNDLARKAAAERRRKLPRLSPEQVGLALAAIGEARQAAVV